MKKNYIFFCLSFFLFQTSLFSQTVLVDDNFSTSTKYIDNTLLTPWKTYTSPTSGLKIVDKADNTSLSFKAITLTTEAMAASNYYDANGLKTLTSLSYEFPQVVDRNLDTIKIEFDCIWETMPAASGWGGGEAGRFGTALIYDFPQGGPKWKQVDSVNLVAPFGRPAYNMRIRNVSDTWTSTHNDNSNYNQTSTTFITYGGGAVAEGEFEKYRLNTSSPWLYWLPGFISEPGSTSPGQPGDKDYPQVPSKKSNTAVYPVTSPIYARIATKTNWKHVTWLIKPEMMQMYYRNTGEPESANVLASFMSIPKYDAANPSYTINKLNADHGKGISSLPVMYKWFDKANAIQFYYSGGEQSYLANVKVQLTRKSSTDIEPAFAQANVGIYPNPLQGRTLYFSGDASELSKNVRITDIAGKTLRTGNDVLTSMDLTGLNKGIYIVSIKIAGASYSRKLIVE